MMILPGPSQAIFLMSSTCLICDVATCILAPTCPNIFVQIYLNIFAGPHREAADDGVTDDNREAAETSETHEALDDSTTEGDGSHADHVW